MTVAQDRSRLVAARSFAPVEFFRFEASPDAAVRGFGAPATGRRPCLVTLETDAEALAHARCDGYSVSAAREGIRLGWCGFTLGGLASAVALGKQAEIRCGVTGKTLHRWSSAELAEIVTVVRRPPLAVAGLRAYVKRLSGCTDPDQIVPFLESYLERHTPRELIGALWRYFLSRAPGELETDMIAGELPAEWQLEWLFHRLVTCDEFVAGAGFPLPGPFEPDFPFGLDAFAAGARSPAQGPSPRPVEATRS